MLKVKPKPKYIHSKNEIRDYAFSKVTITGQWLEFGVASGHSIRRIAKIAPKVYGFDSFKGLPEAWNKHHPIGTFAQNEPPKVPNNVELIVGLFQDTLPKFKKEIVAFLHMDADLYSSTIFVLEQLNDFIIPGTIILFDEYFDPKHEKKATEEWISKYKRSIKHLATNNDQLVVVVNF